MHQDIEKLLNVAKEKGFITEKQCEIIRTKAQQLGEDMAEVEFVLDDIPIKNNETHTPSPIPMTEKPKSNKQGEVKKCPVCGAIVNSFQGKCPQCGYAFEGLDANSSVKMFVASIEKIHHEESGSEDKKIRIQEMIKNFPVPNTKADLIEFIIYMKTKSKSGAYSTSYFAKYSECVEKAKILFPDDEDIKPLVNSYSTKGGLLRWWTSQTKSTKIGLGCLFYYVLGSMIGFILMLIVSLLTT